MHVWTKKLKGKFTENHGQNICRLFHFLEQIVYTTSETELGYYHQEKTVQVASGVPNDISRKSVVDPKIKFRSFSVKNSKRSAAEPSIEKAILPIFVILFPTFCPRISEEADWCF